MKAAVIGGTGLIGSQVIKILSANGHNLLTAATGDALIAKEDAVVAKSTYRDWLPC